MSVEVFKGKTALVTGSARRIGRGIALALARHGANVVVHFDTSAKEAADLAREIEMVGAKAWTLQADISNLEEAETVVPSAIELAGPLDILINNASVFPKGGLLSFSVEELEANLGINAVAPLLMARHFAAQDRDGGIVNMLDSRIVDYDREHAAYHLSKRMLFTLTRMMAIEFAPLVRVNAVAPGLILPPPGEDEAFLERLASSNPLNRYGSVEGVADAVLFLLRSDFITGQVIFVDGGRHLRGNMYGC